MTQKSKQGSVMPRQITIAGVQATPHSIGAPLTAFSDELENVLATSGAVDIVVFPELHLYGADAIAVAARNDALRRAAVPLDSEYVKELGQIAKRAGVWLVPGSICERGPHGELFNTALVFSPDGELVSHYRKVFPWRPSEPYDMGDQFVVFDIDGIGRCGLSICYDAWFPESARQLAWMGAEVVLNIVKTTTPDRAQELVLARANSIVNQTFTVSINCAAPIGQGRSIVVGPEGEVLDEADDAASVLLHTLDLDDVTHVREVGTAGVNRMWSQFTPEDPTLELPIYSGRISPSRWTPQSALPNQEDARP